MFLRSRRSLIHQRFSWRASQSSWTGFGRLIKAFTLWTLRFSMAWDWKFIGVSYRFISKGRIHLHIRPHRAPPWLRSWSPSARRRHSFSLMWSRLWGFIWGSMDASPQSEKGEALPSPILSLDQVVRSFLSPSVSMYTSFPLSSRATEVNCPPFIRDVLQQERCSTMQGMKSSKSKLGVGFNPPSATKLHPSILGPNRQGLKLRSIPGNCWFSRARSSKSTKTWGQSIRRGLLCRVVLEGHVVGSFTSLKADSTIQHSSDCRKPQSGGYPDHSIQLLQRGYLAESSCSSSKSVYLLDLHVIVALYKAEHLTKLVPSIGHHNGLGEEVRHEFWSRWMGRLPVSIFQSLLQDKGSQT